MPLIGDKKALITEDFTTPQLQMVTGYPITYGTGKTSNGNNTGLTRVSNILFSYYNTYIGSETLSHTVIKSHLTVSGDTAVGGGSATLPSATTVGGARVLTRKNDTFLIGFGNLWSSIRSGTSLSSVTGTTGSSPSHEYVLTSIQCQWTFPATAGTYIGTLDLSDCDSTFIKLYNTSAFTTVTGGTWVNLVYKNKNSQYKYARTVVNNREENIVFMYDGETLMQIS